MDALDAKYPFFATAREAVADAAVSLPELVAADAPAVERARERVERALMDGTIASESGAFPAESAYDVQAELLSYPIARILVSLLDSEPAIEKYAAAEAATAIDRIREDLATDDELRSTSTPTVALDDVLAEFDLADAVRPESLRSDVGAAGATATGSESGTGRDPEHYWIAVGPYLRLTSPSWGESWRLVNRALADGEVRVSREELLDALEAAVEDRVREGLPFELAAGEGIAAELESGVADLKRLLSERTYAGPVDVVAPDRLPAAQRPDGFVGSSAGAPYVGGLAALLLDVDLSRSPTAVERALERHARDVGRDGVDMQTGHGLVRPAPTVRAVANDTG